MPEVESEIPFEPLALLVFSDGSVRVDSIDTAVREMEIANTDGSYSVQAFAFMGAAFVPDTEEEEGDDESGYPED
jgi:hypothetical protein